MTMAKKIGEYSPIKRVMQWLKTHYDRDNNVK